jgi:hypothetical protein
MLFSRRSRRGGRRDEVCVARAGDQRAIAACLTVSFCRLRSAYRHNNYYINGLRDESVTTAGS